MGGGTDDRTSGRDHYLSLGWIGVLRYGLYVEYCVEIACLNM